MIKKLSIPVLGLFIALGLSAQSGDLPFKIEEITRFDEPWSMAFMPDGRLLVTEKKGRLSIVSQDGQEQQAVGGLLDVDYGGQGGLGDVALHPEFSDNGMVYISYAESGDRGVRGASGVSIRKYWGAGITATAFCSTMRATCGFLPANGRSSRLHRTCNRLWAS